MKKLTLIVVNGYSIIIVSGKYYAIINLVILYYMKWLYHTNIKEVMLMLFIIIINIIVLSLGFGILDLLDDKYTKALNDFCILECK